jgi:hypothetical protein
MFWRVNGWLVGWWSLSGWMPDALLGRVVLYLTCMRIFVFYWRFRKGVGRFDGGTQKITKNGERQQAGRRAASRRYWWRERGGERLLSMIRASECWCWCFRRGLNIMARARKGSCLVSRRVHSDVRVYRTTPSLLVSNPWSEASELLTTHGLPCEDVVKV